MFFRIRPASGGDRISPLPFGTYMIRRFLRILLLSIVAIAWLPAQSHPPRLVVFVSVDQLKGNVFDRFDSLFTDGFRTMRSDGLRFSRATLNYAPSETGPGHATMSTGCYPWKHGICSNDWINTATEKEIYCVEDTAAEAQEPGHSIVSPRNLLRPAIGDWLKAASPASKVIALSIKDRAAILMGGRHPDLALWFDHDSEHMISSDYYPAPLPAWVTAFNASRWMDHHLPEAWTLLLPDSVYRTFGPDDMPGERRWDTCRTFPHPFMPIQRVDQCIMSPYGNAMLLDLARQAVDGERLGRRDTTDLLCISLSSTDYIGHAFGPDSWEMIDNLVRLDRQLGDFLRFLTSRVGREHLLVVLTADHGALPLPEYAQDMHTMQARRISAADINRPILALDSLLRVRYHATEHVILQNEYVNERVARSAGITPEALAEEVRTGLLRIPGIADVYLRAELESRSTDGRPFLEQYRHGFVPERGGDFVIRFCEGCLVTNGSTGTSHGSPYFYDTNVPILFWGPRMAVHRVDRDVHTVDIAPTLARIIGIAPPSDIDGIALPEVPAPAGTQ